MTHANHCAGQLPEDSSIPEIKGLYALAKDNNDILKMISTRLIRVESRIARLLVHHGVQVDSRAQDKPPK